MERGRWKRAKVDARRNEVYGITYKGLRCTHCLGFLCEGRNDEREREREREKERDRK
jgi:hypothetical protein